jgi:hypothetical protein
MAGMLLSTRNGRRYAEFVCLLGNLCVPEDVFAFIHNPLPVENMCLQIQQPLAKRRPLRRTLAISMGVTIMNSPNGEAVQYRLLHERRSALK